jgi:hypothetical protein
MRRDPSQFQDLVRNLGIELGRCDFGASLPGGFREAAGQCLKPVVHLEAHRITYIG